VIRDIYKKAGFCHKCNNANAKREKRYIYLIMNNKTGIEINIMKDSQSLLFRISGYTILRSLYKEVFLVMEKTFSFKQISLFINNSFASKTFYWMATVIPVNKSLIFFLLLFVLACFYYPLFLFYQYPI
jgi:hypothetical protein